MQVCPLFALAFHMSTTAIDDTSTTLSYSGNWGGHTNETGNRFHGDSYHQVSGAGEVQIPFNGTSITVYADSWNDHDRVYCRILDLDTPWFWFNTSWSTAAVAYGLTMCSAKGLPANKPHVLAMGQLAADGTNKYLDFDWAEASTAPSLANETRVLWDSSFPVVSPPASHADTTKVASTISLTSSASSTASSIDSSSSSSSSASAPTSPPSSSTSSSTIGIGVGVGVGGAILLSLLSIFYLLRRRRRAAYALAAREDDNGEGKTGFKALDPTTPHPVSPSTDYTASHPYAPTPPAPVPEVSSVYPPMSTRGYSVYEQASLSSSRLDDPGSFARRD